MNNFLLFIYFLKKAKHKNNAKYYNYIYTSGVSSDQIASSPYDPANDEPATRIHFDWQAQ